MLFISLFVLMGLIKPSLQVFFFTTCTSSNVVHIYAAPSLLNRCTLNTVARRKKEVRETWVRHRIIFAFHFLFFRGNRKQKEKKNRKYDEMRTKARLQHPQRAAATPRFFFFVVVVVVLLLLLSFLLPAASLRNEEHYERKKEKQPKQRNFQNRQKKNPPAQRQQQRKWKQTKKKELLRRCSNSDKKKKIRKQIERIK